MYTRTKISCCECHWNSAIGHGSCGFFARAHFNDSFCLLACHSHQFVLLCAHHYPQLYRWSPWFWLYKCDFPIDLASYILLSHPYRLRTSPHVQGHSSENSLQIIYINMTIKSKQQKSVPFHEQKRERNQIKKDCCTRKSAINENGQQLQEQKTKKKTTQVLFPRTSYHISLISSSSFSSFLFCVAVHSI